MPTQIFGQGETDTVGVGVGGKLVIGLNRPSEGGGGAPTMPEKRWVLQGRREMESFKGRLELIAIVVRAAA